MSEALPGRCQCGAVRYELRGAPLTCYACHCLGCQRSAGSAYTISLLVHGADLRVVEGELRESAFAMPSGERTWHGCARCGSSLWYTSPVAPEFAALKPGTLDEPARFEPVAHLWTQHKQPHVQLSDGAQAFDQQPATWASLMQLWTQRQAD